MFDGKHPAVTGATVVVVGNRIVAAGTVPVDVEANDRVVDLGGRTVMSGVVTFHFHATYHDFC